MAVLSTSSKATGRRRRSCALPFPKPVPGGTVHAIRAEAAAETIGDIEAVSARALAALDTLLELGAPWLTEGATAWLHKGRDFRSEIALAHGRWQFDLVKHQSRVDAASVVLQISNLRPRHPAED